MGVNMPARAVVFSELRKHDGQKFRDLLSSKYKYDFYYSFIIYIIYYLISNDHNY